MNESVILGDYGALTFPITFDNSRRREAPCRRPRGDSRAVEISV